MHLLCSYLLPKTAKYFTPRNLFYCFLGLFLVQQVFVLVSFSLFQSDTDQMIMWEAAKDMSQGNFYTPYFYGQQYNSMAEALLAVPFILGGLKIWYAVPLSTWIMSLTPWLILFAYANKWKNYSGGILILLLFFTLDSQFSILTHMSRGFVQSIFFTFIGLGFWWFGKQKPTHFFLLVFFSLFGFLQVPNNALLFPCIALLAWNSKWLKKPYILSAIGGICINAILFVLANKFYLGNSDFIVHPNTGVAASIDILVNNLKSTGMLFTHIFKGGEYAFYTFLLTSILVGIVSKKYWQMALFLALIVLTLSINKVTDTTESVFFSGGRFYLAIPFCLTLFLNQKINLNSKMHLGLAFLCIGLFLTQTGKIDSDINTKPWRAKYSPVLTFTLDELNCACDSIKRISKSAEAIIIHDHYFVEALSIGCPILIDSFPMSSRYGYERRPWFKKKLDASKPNELIILDRFGNIDSIKFLFPNATPIWIEGQAYKLKNNKALEVDSIMKRWNGIPRID